MAGPAEIDPAFNIHKVAALLIDLRVLGCGASEGEAVIIVAVAAGIAAGRCFREKRLASVDPEEAGIGEVIILKGLRLRLQEVIAGFERVGRDVGYRRAGARLACRKRQDG